MFFLKYSTYLISILSITGILSSPQIQDSIKSDVRLRRERDFNSLSTNQGNSISFQPDSSTPSDQSLNEITIKLQQAGTLLEPEFSPPPQDSALVPFDENGGLTNIIPSFPQLNLFPQSDTPDPNIPPDTHTDSPTERKEPDCQYGKFAFCCQQGPPARGTNKKGLSPAVLRERERERTSRLGKCRKWNKNNPACDVPENEACCTCVSKRQAAFFCYNPNGIKSPPRPVPTLLTDPNPSEPDNSSPPEQKRDLIDNNSEDLFAAAKPPLPTWKHPGGRTRFDSTCSDEFLENLGLGPGRHYKPSIHTPENPYKPKPDKNRPSTEEQGWEDG